VGGVGWGVGWGGSHIYKYGHTLWKIRHSFLGTTEQLVILI